MDLDWTDYSVLGVVATVLVGFFLRFTLKKSSTLAEYIWGDRDLGIWGIAGSLIATNVSGMLFFLASEIYQFGVNIVFETVGLLLLTIVIRLQAPVLWKLKLESLNEYGTLRYGKKVRILCALLSSFSITWSTVFVTYTASIFLSKINELSKMTNATIISVASYLLSALSGFRGVVWTDAVQCVVIFSTMLVLILISLTRFERVWDVIFLALEGGRFEIDWSLDPTHRLTWWSSVFCYGFQYIFYVTLVSPAMYQRYCALPNLKAVNTVAVLHILGVILAKITAFTLGYFVYATYASCDPLLSGEIGNYDEIVPYFIQDLSNGKPFVQGVFLAGFLCATFSTLTTSINTLSINIYKDFLEVKTTSTDDFVKAKRRIQLVGFLATLSCLFTMYFLQRVRASVVELTTYNVFFQALYAAIIMAGIFLPRVNSKCVFCGAGIGFIFYVINETGRYMNQLSFPIKKMRTDGCRFNATLVENPFSNVNSSQAFYLFKLSYFCQFALHFTVITLIMLMASFFTERDVFSRSDEKLMSPLVRPCSPESKASISLKRSINRPDRNACL